MRRPFAAMTLALALVAVLLVPSPAPVRAAVSGGPKVVIVVGATHSATSKYRSYGDAAYAEANKYTSNVVKVYSPNATWSKVKAAAVGASILIYFGHGNGWPSPYTYDSKYTTKDGFGLNATAGSGDNNNKYYGEPYVSTLDLAPNAIVMLHHLCYASGNSEPGDTAPSVSTAKKRIDNYGAGFLKSKARVVLADGHRGPVDYLRAIFTTNQSIEQVWRTAPGANGNVSTFNGTRSAGAKALMDPDSPTSGFYRSLIGDPSLTTVDIRGGFAVPGRAAPKTAGAPIYDTIPTATATASVAEPAAILPADTRLKLLERVAGSGSTAVFRVEGLDDAGIAGYVMARDLDPRDSIGPAVLTTVGGGGGAYTTVDTGGVHRLSGTLNEAADWTVTISRGDTTWASASGSGTSFALDLEPDAALGDGKYTYRVSGTDDWANGPSVTTGTFTIDTVAPEFGAVTPAADALPWFSPNGDTSRESVSWSASDTEAGSIGLRVVDADGVAVRKTRVPAVKGTTTVTWTGRDDDGDVVADGRYDVVLVPRDAAGNDGPSIMRSVVVDTTLKSVASSKAAIYPQDGDTLARTTTLSFTLLDPATVTWVVVDADGAVVRTLLSGEVLPAGRVSRSFDGRHEAGGWLPKGAYRSVVTLDGDAEPVIRGSASFDMNAFVVTLSDATPARGQTITVYATSAESLGTKPRVHVYQPGLSRWSVAMTKVSTGRYKAKVTLKSSGGKGTVRIRVHAEDAGGRGQSTSRYVPIH